jgi:hypothetical protein
MTNEELLIRQLWQLKQVDTGVAQSTRKFKKTAKGGVSRKDETLRERNEDGSVMRRKKTLYRDGSYFAHGYTDYQLWWEFLVRAYQSSDFEVDKKRYADWGPAENYYAIDIWNSKSRREGFRTFWKEYGIELFAEDDNRGIQVFTGDDVLNMSSDKFYLEFDKNASAKELATAAKRLIEQNVSKQKLRNVITAKNKLSVDKFRVDAFRRILKVYDMRRVDSSRFAHLCETSWRKGNFFSQDFTNQIHGLEHEAIRFKVIQQLLWRAGVVLRNVAAGEFPGADR